MLKNNIFRVFALFLCLDTAFLNTATFSRAEETQSISNDKSMIVGDLETMAVNNLRLILEGQAASVAVIDEPPLMPSNERFKMGTTDTGRLWVFSPRAKRWRPNIRAEDGRLTRTACSLLPAHPKGSSSP